ncbi:MAG: hypothetical protein QXG98_01655 [Candidatus Micrarchaeia archaeon]
MHFLAPVLLIAAAAQAQGIEGFVSDFRLANETFSIVELPDAGGVYFVGIGGQLVVVDGRGGSYSVVTEPKEIFPLLVAYQQHSGAKLEGAFPTKGELEDVRARVLAFNASRQPKEGKCLRESGLDKFPCYDRQSCFKACYTPLCKPLALGFGWPFVENLSKWKNATDALDANVTAFFELYDPLAEAPEAPSTQDIPLARVEELESALPRLIGLVRGMGAAAGAIATNPIFDEYAYSFCDPIPFDWQNLLAARRMLENFTARLRPLAELAHASYSVADEGRRRADIAFERQQARVCANFSARAKAALGALEAYAAGAAREVAWEGSAEKLAAARSAAEAAKERCEQEDFHAAAAAIETFERARQALEENLSGLLERKREAAHRLAVLWEKFGVLAERAKSVGLNASATEHELLTANATLSTPLSGRALDALVARMAELDGGLDALGREVARREEAGRTKAVALGALAVVLVLIAVLTVYYMRVVARTRQ